MKKGTRTWKLWVAVLLYLFGIGIVSTLYGEYILSRELNGFLQLLATVVLLCLVGYCIVRTVNLLERILKRRRSW
jgi:hypothetical protein